MIMAASNLKRVVVDLEIRMSVWRKKQWAEL